MPAKPIRRETRLSPRRKLARFLVRQDAGLVDDLVALRRRRKMSQTDVAEKIGVSQSAVARFESGERDARLSTIRRYAMAVDACVEHEVRALEDHGAWRSDPSVVPKDWTSLVTWEKVEPAPAWERVGG